MKDLSDRTTAAGPSPAKGGDPGAERVSLVLHHRDGAKVVPLLVGAPVVVGRAVPADVIVRDINVSRRHARFSWQEDGVWVEDLGSRNGTLVNGERVERARVRPGDEVALGSATVLVHQLSPREGALHSVEGHDRFLSRLEGEVERARAFGRPLAFLMLQGTAGERAHVRHWLPHVKKLLRTIDLVGLYGPSTLLVALPEMDIPAASDLAQRIVAVARPSPPPLLCGVSAFPATASSAEELVDVARRAIHQASPTDRVVVWRDPGSARAGSLPAQVVRNPAMQRLFETVERVARSTVPVLIVGETGTGKEVVARALHERSPRRDGPMRSINCGAIPATLLDSMLFGHERGAFTGADRQARGVFEQAHGGTVFLDEVGELSAAAQSALLRVLEHKRLTRLGADQEIAVDIRVIAATNRDLEAMCGEAGFRWDLYYRLNTVILQLPPLRDRRDEIEPLALLFLSEAAQACGSRALGMAPEALAALQRYDWPGNVRELRNVIERAVAIAEGEAITLEDLSERVRDAATAPSEGPLDGDSESRFKDLVQEYETRLITEALLRAGGNKTEAARLLKMPLRTLTNKIRAYGIATKQDA